MTKTRKPSSREIDSALSGGVAPGLENLSTWADELRSLSTAQVAPEIAAAHISSIAELARETPVAAAGAVKISRLQRLRKRLVLSSLLSGMVAKVFAASVALATVTGGVVATGALPDAVQDPIAGLYNAVGFDFPTSDGEECATDSAVDCSDSQDPDGEGTTTDPNGGEGTGSTGPNNTNGNKNGPDNTNGNKNGPGDNNPNDPGDNNGKGPGNNNGKGPGDNNGKGPGADNGKGPGDNNGKGPGDNNGRNQDGGDEG